MGAAGRTDRISAQLDRPKNCPTGGSFTLLTFLLQLGQGAGEHDSDRAVGFVQCLGDLLGGQSFQIAHPQGRALVLGKRFHCGQQADLPLIAGKRLAGGRHAGDQQIDQTAPLAPLAGVQAHFTIGVSLLAAEKFAVSIDDPPLGDLAEPAERVALRQIDLGDRTDCFGVDILNEIVGLDFPPQCAPQPPLDISGQRPAARFQPGADRLAIAGAKPLEQGIFRFDRHGGPRDEILGGTRSEVSIVPDRYQKKQKRG